MTGEDVIREVRWRFRICGYMFRVGAVWILFGGVGLAMGSMVRSGDDVGKLFVVISAVGYGIFSVAFALTLAIYRCPVCDKYLSRFRPRKAYCPSCGVKVQETS